MSHIFKILLASQDFSFVINLDIFGTAVLINATSYHKSKLTKIYNFATSNFFLQHFLLLMDNE